MKNHLAIITFLLLTFVAAAQNSTISNNFWVGYIINGTDQTPQYQKLIAVGDTACDINVDNYGANVHLTTHLNAGSRVEIILPNSAAIPSTFTTPAYNGFHVTSTACISLFAVSYALASISITQVLPSHSLDTIYMVQDFRGDHTRPATSGAEMIMVATEDNTVIKMVVPSSLAGSILAPGDTLTVNLQQGQSCLLDTPPNNTFTGCVVRGNKPFALFQGNKITGIPAGSPSGDMIYEQCIPIRDWGTDFAIVSTPQRTVGDYIKITSFEDNCIVNISGTASPITLQSGQTHQFILPVNSTRRIRTTKPVCVGSYQQGSDYYGEHGDASQLMVTPLDRGIQRGGFTTYESTRIHTHYVNIVIRTQYVSTMALDGNNIASQFSTLDTAYSYARISVTNNAHFLSNPAGPFIAAVYGIGQVESYAYNIGMVVDSIDTAPLDTTIFYDTICQGLEYSRNGFLITSQQTSTVGTGDFSRNDFLHHYILHLTILPVYNSDVYSTIAYGDTCYFNGQPYTIAGNYSDTLTTIDGCDSIITLHLIYIYDTVRCYDSVCVNHTYSGYGFNIPPHNNAGTYTYMRDTIEQDFPRRYLLTLTVLPNLHSELSFSIITSDTLFYADTTLTIAGDYIFVFTAANGCDSIVALHLTYIEVEILASADGLCPGDTMTLTAAGTHYYHWASEPVDPDLDAQQGQASIIISPQQTTIYSLLDTDGHTIASYTVNIAPPPVLCYDVQRPFIDFDHPVVYFTDCSEGRAYSIWTFSDGLTINGEKARRQFHYPLPDSIEISLSSCNAYHCCADTTFIVPMRIRSVWFPNIFTPGLETNNSFGCVASFDIVKFSLYIYTRQGLLVYHTNDPTAWWDGTHEGTPMPQGTYVYYWHVRDGSDFNQNGTGTVTLLR